MVYHGIPFRTELIKDSISFRKNDVVLEIGVSTGHSTFFISKKCKRIVGLDISKETINFLKKLRKKDIEFVCYDILSKDFIKEYSNCFDKVVSMDTFEHLETPNKFFKAVYSSLKKDGVALIGFPNASAKGHHGVTWFEDKNDLISMVNKSGLKIRRFIGVRKSNFLVYFLKIFFYWPKKLLLMAKHDKGHPQQFEETISYKLNKSNSIFAKLLTYYTNLIYFILSRQFFFRLFNYHKIKDIRRSYVLLELTK